MSREIDQEQGDRKGVWNQRVLGPFTARAALLGLFSLLVAGVTIGGIVAVTLLNRPTGEGLHQVEIQKGMSVPQISRLLYKRGIIRSPKLLRLLSLLNGTSRRLTAGGHTFHGGMSTWQVLQELEVHRDITRDVTIPEGLRKESIARLLARSLDLDERKLNELMSDSKFVKLQGIDASSLEGYLFPETYNFSLTMTEEQVIWLMVSQFKKIVDKKLRRRARQKGMSIHEVVTMASIIEGEAQVGEERKIISAVYHNRLKRRMRLQADPTVQYAIKDGPRRLFYKDYRISSPYNTYKHRGLPPGPIMSPGEASLKAALYPADVDFLYFVARGDGSHIFSRNAAEHERAKRETRSARRRTWSSPKTR
ncbi:MAG TPA: endolytic transglycosylase MltG [Candidatus Latescibacteria bacterium]|nr:endolytic transglycosylase MltG [Candidatus Latescibacterota bacterium]|tara:strand:+ start:507 stop:1601 length:1095 start_codon:yes stop_codon:yes gene_type:complete